MKKKALLILLLVFVIVFSIMSISKYVKQQQEYKKIEKAKIRIQEIRRDVEKELPDFLHLISPNHCENGGQIRVNSLINNRGMDKSIFLDTDGKTLCKVNVMTKCGENGEQTWDLKVGCKDYQEEGFVDWGY